MTMDKQHITLVAGQKSPGRVETGVVQFNDDWPGVFIRGDCAFGYAMYLRAVLDNMDEINPTDSKLSTDYIARVGVERLLELLESSNVNSE